MRTGAPIGTVNERHSPVAAIRRVAAMPSMGTVAANATIRTVDEIDNVRFVITITLRAVADRSFQ